MKNRTVYWQASVAFAINFFAGFGFFIAFLVQYFDKEIVIYDLLFYALILWAISAAFLVMTSYSWPGFSQDTKATPSYRSAEPSQPMYSQAQKAPSVSADSWTCTCGRVNPSYQTTCSCGVKKPAPKANSNRSATVKVEATGDWRCSCGRANPSYQTTCSCGVKKPVPQPAKPVVDATSYLGKKFCSGCGELIADSGASTCPACGSKYLTVITDANAQNIIPNIEKH